MNKIGIGTAVVAVVAVVGAAVFAIVKLRERCND
jgi:hypothetical protein